MPASKGETDREDHVILSIRSKKHRSHRGHSGAMDDKLYYLYFPYGVDNDEHINEDELALNDNMIEYMNDLQHSLET